MGKGAFENSKITAKSMNFRGVTSILKLKVFLIVQIAHLQQVEQRVNAMVILTL